MTKKRTDPAKLALRFAEKRRQDFDRVGLAPEGAALPANTDIEVHQARRSDVQAGVRGNVERARRLDAFEALKVGMAPGAYDAARRLERDTTIRRGEHDRGRPVDRVDGDEHSAFCRNDAIIAAGERVDAVLRLIGRQDARLLSELVSPSATTLLRATCWRGIVRLITGEAHAHAQGAAVRAACANLAYAYQEMERSRPRAA